MVKLQDMREVKIIKTIATGGEIEVYKSLLAGDIEKINSLDDKDKTIPSLKAFIKSWNFTDQDEKPLPVTDDNVRLLDARDIKTIMDIVSVEDFTPSIGQEASEK